MRVKWLAAGSVLIWLAVVPGCSKISEPWVSSPEQLKEERHRSPEQQKKLRERAIVNQNDR